MRVLRTQICAVRIPDTISLSLSLFLSSALHAGMPVIGSFACVHPSTPRALEAHTLHARSAFSSLSGFAFSTLLSLSLFFSLAVSHFLRYYASYVNPERVRTLLIIHASNWYLTLIFAIVIVMWFSFLG